MFKVKFLEHTIDSFEFSYREKEFKEFIFRSGFAISGGINCGHYGIVSENKFYCDEFSKQPKKSKFDSVFWGKNDFGQLGTGNTTYYSSPKQVGSLTNWLILSAGFNQSAAIKTDGTLWSWGGNNAGQLGLGDTTNRTTPARIGALTNWVTIAVGADHTLAITS
jgi:hypothetical protein